MGCCCGGLSVSGAVPCKGCVALLAWGLISGLVRMACSRSPLVSIPTSLPPVVVTGKRRKPVSSMICAASRMDMSGATVRTCRFIISWALRVLCRACSSGASIASAVRSSSSSAVRTKPRRIGKSPALIRSPVLIMPWSRSSPSMTGSARNGAASSRLTTFAHTISNSTNPQPARSSSGRRFRPRSASTNGSAFAFNPAYSGYPIAL